MVKNCSQSFSSSSEQPLPERTIAQLAKLASSVRERTGTKGRCVLLIGRERTGKTLAAQMLTDNLGLAVCRVDLSAVVSKYISMKPTPSSASVEK